MAVTTGHCVAESAQFLLGDEPGVALIGIHWCIQQRKIGVDDVWNAHLFVMVPEFVDVLAFLRHLNPMWSLTDALAMFHMSIEQILSREDLNTAEAWVLPILIVVFFVLHAGQVFDPDIVLVLTAGQ